MRLSVLEVSFEATLIWPRHLTLSIHLVIYEIAFIGLSRVYKIVLAFSFELSIDKITFVDVSVLRVLALASLLSFSKIAVVLALPLVPRFLSFTFLLIV